jgi:pilus assembly protein CpaB
MGNMKAVVPIVISLVIAIAGSFFIYQWIQTQTAPTETVRMETDAVPVLVAKADIGWGTRLNAEMVTTAPYFKEALPPNYLTKFEDVAGRIVITPIRSGEPVLKHRLAPQDIQTGGISAILKDGHRAVAVKGDKVIGISGFIKPGDKVDVLVSVKNTDNDTEITKIVLQNILVLATGTQVEEGADRKPYEVDVYTLEVTPDQSERLTLAATEGKIQLALRGLIDSEEVLTRGATIASTLAGVTQAPQAKTPQANPAPARKWVPRQKSHTVEIIKGTSVSSQKFDM